MTRTLESILIEHPFMKGLKPEHARLLVGCASNAVFRQGEVLFREGDPADRFYIVRTGCVSLEISTPGKAPIVLQTIGNGEILGWSWLIPPHEWQYLGRALETTHLIALDAKCLRGKCDQDHDLGYEMLRRFSTVLAQRLEATRLQLLDLYAGS